jgi:hypothetical protein
MEQQGTGTDSPTRLVNRRTVAIGAAWTAPVVLFAVASPSASASPLPVENRSATLATITGEKGEAVGTNRTVTFTLSFGAITGTNTVRIVSIDGGGPWTGLATPDATVTPGTISAPFVVGRPGIDNSTVTVTLHYEVNGIEKTVSVTIKNNVPRS